MTELSIKFHNFTVNESTKLTASKLDTYFRDNVNSHNRDELYELCLCQKALLFFRKGGYDNAVKMYQELLCIDKGNLAYQLGFILMK